MFNFLYKIFKLGIIPNAEKIVLEKEGINYLAEELKSVVTFHKYKAPGKRFYYKKVFGRSALVITNKRLFVLFGKKRLINIAINDKNFSKIKIDSSDFHHLTISFHPEDFSTNQSGIIEVKITIPDSKKIMTALPPNKL